MRNEQDESENLCESCFCTFCTRNQTAVNLGGGNLHNHSRTLNACIWLCIWNVLAMCLLQLQIFHIKWIWWLEMCECNNAKVSVNGCCLLKLIGKQEASGVKVHLVIRHPWGSQKGRSLVSRDNGSGSKWIRDSYKLRLQWTHAQLWWSLPGRAGLWVPNLESSVNADGGSKPEQNCSAWL